MIGMILSRLRVPLLVTSCLLAPVVIAGQAPPEGKLLTQLKQLFPAASSFSPKEPAPPHFNVYTSDASGAKTLVGLAFYTTELEPLERGYDGPIKILVGMDMKGVLTGVIIAEHHEPYGYFSIDRKEFPAQFAGKS